MKSYSLNDFLESIILFLCILVFFANGNILTKYTSIFQYIILILSILYCILRGKIRTNLVVGLWLLIILYFFLGLFYSYDSKSTLSMLKVYVVAFSLLICEFDSYKIIKFLKILEIVIIIGAISIIVSTFINNMIINYFSFFITTDPARTLSEITEYSFSGLFAEKGNAAFMLNIGIGIIISEYLSKRKLKFNYIVKLLLFLVALILTNKRALLVFPVIIFVIIYMFFKDKNKLFKMMRIAVVGIIILIIMLKLFPVMGSVFDRFINDDDNHRSELQEICLRMHEKNSLIGMGLSSYNKYAYNIGFRLYISGTKNGVWTYHAHNIYYQLLAECGYIGLSVIILTFIYCVYQTVKLLRSKLLEDDKDRTKLIVMSLYIQLLFILYGWTGNTFYYYQQILIYFMGLSILVKEMNNSKVKKIEFKEDIGCE